MSRPQDSDLYKTLESRDHAPEPLKRVLAREQADYDCLSCRVMGATAFTALGTYTYWSGHRELRTRELEIMRSGSKLTMAARRLGITGLSGMLIGLGLWRGFM
ncbi:hypothetical protein E4T42_00694 [Aureobasidium subglaciale]|nr:hypothetical protein E4T42_00694 [Aureobasidium subglaciale]